MTDTFDLSSKRNKKINKNEDTILKEHLHETNTKLNIVVSVLIDTYAMINNHINAQYAVGIVKHTSIANFLINVFEYMKIQGKKNIIKDANIKVNIGKKPKKSVKQINLIVNDKIKAFWQDLPVTMKNQVLDSSIKNYIKQDN